MKKLNYLCLLIGMMMFAVSCVSPEEWHIQYENIVPGPVSNVLVENVNGGAIISLSLPSDIKKQDMMGAKAVYSLTPDGEVMERWTSPEKDTIVLEGYGNTDERIVTLYAVHKNGHISEGVQVIIKPLTPPIHIIRESLKAAATFGGVQCTWDNPLRKNMGITLYVEDSISHEMVVFDKYFSNSIDGNFTFRSFEPIEQHFSIEMFDRWQNYAQTLETTLTPLEEIEIMCKDERGFNIWSLFDDGRVISGDNSSPWRYTYRCDGHNDREQFGTARDFEYVFNYPNGSSGSFWFVNGSTQTLDKWIPGASVVRTPFPIYVTFDMGRKAIYSRMRIIARARSPQFSSDFPVKLDVWGSNDPKTIEQVGDGSREANQAYWSSWRQVNGTDAWKNDWTKIASLTFYLASGENKFYDGIPLTAEDLYAIQNGYDFDFNINLTDAFRYLRWEVLETNMDQSQLTLIGLQYWGSYAE